MSSSLPGVRVKLALLGLFGLGVLFAYQTRLVRNLSSWEPLRPRWWNTLEVAGFAEEELEEIVIV